MADVVRAMFQRDRLTGQVAIGLVGVLCVSAVVFGIGMASAKYQVSDIGAWLSANRKGMVVHVNGLAGKVDGKTGLISNMRGHDIKIVQDGNTVLIIDRQTGVVSRIDPSQLKVEQSRAFGAAGLQVVVGRGAAYAVDPARGTVQQIDPVTLSTVGRQAVLTAPLGQAAIDAEGTLWVPAPANGQVVPFQAGRHAQPVTVGKARDALAITIAAGSAVVTNSTAATATVVGTSGPRLRVALPSTVSQAGPGGVLFPATTDGQVVPLLVKETGSLVLLNTGSGRHSTVRLKLTRHRFGSPQMLGSKVYIPDESAGTLVVYNSATNSFDSQVVVNGRPGAMEVFVSGGLLWANDPSGERAIVLDGTGAIKEIRKYENKVPGGPRRPIPTQGPAGGDHGNPGTGGNNGGGNNGGNGSAQPRPTRTPMPWEPPTPPVNLRTSADTGAMTVEFQPSVGGKPTGYVLKGVPAGAVVTPSQIAPGGTPTFRVEGGTCGQEYRFRVAVRYQDRGGATAEALSEPSDPVMPCVPPGAPRGVQAVATAAGAQVTWAAPVDAGDTPVRYRVNWSGPTSGSRDGLTGTSVTLGEVWRNGQYTFTVTSSNGAGVGQQAQTSPPLAGPAQAYAIRHNGNSYAYLNVAPDTKSADVSRIFNNGHTLTVLCQKKGAYYAHPNGLPYFAGDLYDYVEYAGRRGYMIGYLVGTPKEPWQEYAGPPLWECE